MTDQKPSTDQDLVIRGLVVAPAAKPDHDILQGIAQVPHTRPDHKRAEQVDRIGTGQLSAQL